MLCEEAENARSRSLGPQNDRGVTVSSCSGETLVEPGFGNQGERQEDELGENHCRRGNPRAKKLGRKVGHAPGVVGKPLQLQQNKRANMQTDKKGMVGQWDVPVE